jgi:hypothetical protein
MIDRNLFYVLAKINRVLYFHDISLKTTLLPLCHSQLTFISYTHFCENCIVLIYGCIQFFLLYLKKPLIASNLDCLIMHYMVRVHSLHDSLIYAQDRFDKIIFRIALTRQRRKMNAQINK